MNELAIRTERQLIARTPAELEVAHEQLLEWCDRRISEAQDAANEEEESLEIARERKWRLTNIKSRLSRHKALVLFYGKVRKALEAGYFLVPNFQMDIFAIRTKRGTPTGHHIETGKYPHASAFTQSAQRLPPGEGDYQSPDPFVGSEASGEGDEKTIASWASEWDEPSFPFELATPAVMTRTGEVMAVKLFDEVGIARDTWGAARGDPMILGRFVDPRSSRIGATFFIAWGLNFERF